MLKLSSLLRDQELAKKYVTSKDTALAANPVLLFPKVPELQKEELYAMLITKNLGMPITWNTLIVKWISLKATLLDVPSLPSCHITNIPKMGFPSSPLDSDKLQLTLLSTPELKNVESSPNGAKAPPILPLTLRSLSRLRENKMEKNFSSGVARLMFRSSLEPMGNLHPVLTGCKSTSRLHQTD